MTEDPRQLLERIIRERGEDYASLSRLIGRNSSYIQQFIKRGVPRKLDESDRVMLARYFGVDEHLLGGSQEKASRRAESSLRPVPTLDVSASAGPGALPGDEQGRATARFAFDERWLRDLSGGDPARLSMIRVAGDSMTPTLADGDDILVDGSDAADRLRDGIYVLRIHEELVVKRIARHPVGGAISIRSDNPAYPAFADCKPADIAVIGRVVWAGRRIS